jgi:uncharacterized membrane protein
MKKFCVGLLAAGLLVFTGCNTSPTGGGGAAGGTFKVTGAPAMTKTVKHDTSEAFKLKIDKGKDFKEDITLSVRVDPADKGVTASVDPTTVKAGDAPEFTVKVTASEKAADGDYDIIVLAKPAKGESVEHKFKVRVPKK